MPFFSVWYVDPLCMDVGCTGEHVTGTCFAFLPGGWAGMWYATCIEGRLAPVHWSLKSPFKGDALLDRNMYLVPFSCVAYSSALEMGAVGSSKMSATWFSWRGASHPKARYMIWIRKFNGTLEFIIWWEILATASLLTLIPVAKNETVSSQGWSLHKSLQN
jgi:hypothetical protein